MVFESAPTLIGDTVELKQVLGSGGFGKVYMGYDRKRKINVAVKSIGKRMVELQNILSYVEREIEVMRKIKHPHVVKLLDAFESSSAYNLVMELAPNGELFDKIVNSERFDERTARMYFQQLICAVHYCHGLNIVHRDLKAENLLLGKGNELKVCDWGLSRYTREGRVKDENRVLFHSLAGSIDYQAPEVLRGQGYEGSACDMWSCGAILFFMLCGYLPFTDRSDVQTRRRILTCQYNKHNRYLSDGASDLIAHLLEVDPGLRYTTDDVIVHPWFQLDLDPALFPEVQLCVESTPQSPKSGVFIQRVLTPSGGFEDTTAPSREGLDEIHRAFVSCNVDGSGFLNFEEVRDALIKLKNNEAVSEKEVQQFMSNFALDKSGRISEEEFVIGCTKNQDVSKKYNISRMANLFHYDLEKEYLEEVRRAFDSIDVKHTGLITPESLEKLKLNCTKSEIHAFFQAIDPQNTGKYTLTFEQFVNMCSQYDAFKNHPLTQRLRRLDQFFDVTEINSLKAYLSTGFTVAGSRENIVLRIRSQEKTLSTRFEGGGGGLLYGTYTQDDKKVLEVGIHLLPTVVGYTKIVPYRIAGKTKEFHHWFLELRKALRAEILRCEEDTVVRGSPELF
ncbi:protein kinase [Trypanosoma grayi]|uniref:protein kinase n=1 Tax=Trypanosoma grayi TaxID=71804 RepID=UPI0004F465CE|nr:protein kinase [Trypanosoma grayi]KEG11954.1 protein kinase [Trypanosoma grayi]